MFFLVFIVFFEGFCFFFLHGSVYLFVHMRANLSLTLSAYFRAALTLSNHNERERESRHSADPSTSPEEIFLIQEEFVLPKPLTSNHFPPNSACNQAKKRRLPLFVWWVYTLPSSLLSYFSPTSLYSVVNLLFSFICRAVLFCHLLHTVLVSSSIPITLEDSKTK